MSECLDLEFSIAPILARQMERGVLFDKNSAELLEATLLAEKSRIRFELQQLFKPRVINLGEVTPKVTSKRYHTTKGCTFTKIKFQEYNPSSRQQTIQRLISELGWNPQEFTDKGNPELDEEIIESLPFPQIRPLQLYYIIDKRLGQLANGVKAWLKVVKEDGRIYGSVLQSGTVTGRMSHFGPNTAQIPSNDKPWGKECRSLFTVPQGKAMLGVDADALELRCLAGYLKPLDNGRFIKTILEGRKEDGTDMHSINKFAYKLEKYETGRDCSKVLIYASMYGAKNPKLGLILQQFGVDFHDYVDNFDEELKKLIAWSNKKQTGFSIPFLECLLAGKTARDNFGEKLPELPALIADVQAKWSTNGYLKGLDGRKLYPRSLHAAFNTLLQSAGAIIMKKALYIADSNLQKMYTPGKEYEFILNIHDEWQLEVVDDQEIICYIKTILENSIKEAGEYFNFKCPMKGNSIVGRNWSETH